MVAEPRKFEPKKVNRSGFQYLKPGVTIKVRILYSPFRAVKKGAEGRLIAKRGTGLKLGLILFPGGAEWAFQLKYLKILEVVEK